MNKKYNFTYQTKNTLNGKTYIGVHSTNNINDGYIGNGIKSKASCDSQIKRGNSNKFVRAVNKYGYSNFKMEVLCFFDTIEEAYEEESIIVNTDWVINEGNYNTALGGFYSKKIPELHKEEEYINELFSNPNISYREISELFGKTKGSWINLINEETFKKRRNTKKDSFRKGLTVINLNNEEHTLNDKDVFFKNTGLDSKSLYKLNKTGYSKKWFLKGSERYDKLKKEISNCFIKVNGIEYPLVNVYLVGISNFSVSNGIKLPTLEKKIKDSKQRGKKK
jgi:hypothetical protein